ncbi:MAG: alpha-glucan family phosphorylase, partial [Planctomycetes bacterium]|nr:alpha-glucan family phosphorylase [Planctomycetota bacterium]
MIQKFTVVPRIPKRLKPLQEIAYNLRWGWNRNAVALFRRIDIDLWEKCEHNPVALLGALHPQRLRSLQDDDAFLAHMDSVHDELRAYLSRSTWYSRVYEGKLRMRIAYFSFEFGIHECLPIYSGGLGALAGDHIKSADELGLPLVGVGLAYQQGYYRQVLNSDGWQQERYPDNDFYNIPLTPMRDEEKREVTIEVEFPLRKVAARIWRLDVGRVPLFLLDTNIAANEPGDRAITARLYGGDLDMRIRQEILLGIGGIRVLEKLGLPPTICHMNEGHSAFLALERIRMLMARHELSFEEAREATRVGHVFTTHTPVPAGNDRFTPEMVVEYFKDYMKDLGLRPEQFLGLGRENPDDPRENFCMTVLALRLASHANGVSRLHGSISRRMWRRIWPGIPERELPISHVTNGVHTQSWLSDEFARLFERHMGPQWLDDPMNRGIWQRLGEIPDNELWRSKERLRDRLVSFVRQRLKRQYRRMGSPSSKLLSAEEVLDPQVLTICFARRFATYKRAYLILKDLGRLRRLLLDRERPVQLVMAGKAHPHDHPGKEIIRQIAQLSRDAELQNRIVFLEDYDLEVARQLLQGADVWLNTPRRPMEASGTSGMKAAINGALNVSILDGWWAEGFSGENGWSIGNGEEMDDHTYQDEMESRMLYDILENEVVRLFYHRGPDDVPREWVARMKASLMSICPHFNTNRMVEEYAERFYLPAALNSNMLAKDDFREARSLAAWKSFVAEHWSEVAILSVEADTTRELEIGSELPIEVRVLLGSFRPEDISLEVLHGPLDASGEIA